LVPGKKGILVVEMNNGQMLDDVSAIVAKRVPLHFYGRMGGMVPYPDEIDAVIDEMIHGEYDVNRDARGVWLAKMRELVGTGA
jgi:2-oxoglutarate ferredoxin oxidoreductase subunit alpha